MACQVGLTLAGSLRPDFLPLCRLDDCQGHKVGSALRVGECWKHRALFCVGYLGVLCRNL